MHFGTACLFVDAATPTPVVVVAFFMFIVVVVLFIIVVVAITDVVVIKVVVIIDVYASTTGTWCYVALTVDATVIGHCCCYQLCC